MLFAYVLKNIIGQNEQQNILLYSKENKLSS